MRRRRTSARRATARRDSRKADDRSSGLAVGPSRAASRRPDPDVHAPRVRATRRRLVRYFPSGWPKMIALGQSPRRASEKHGEARVAECCKRTIQPLWTHPGSNLSQETKECGEKQHGASTCSWSGLQTKQGCPLVFCCLHLRYAKAKEDQRGQCWRLVDRRKHEQRGASQGIHASIS